MTETDVLVIGAGPTGLMSTLEISLQNIPSCKTDSLEVPSDRSRALVLHCQSLEPLKRHKMVRASLITAFPPRPLNAKSEQCLKPLYHCQYCHSIQVEKFALDA